MAISPVPDNVPQMMQNDFGTVVLITDVSSDKYLKKHRETKNKVPPDRYSKWCGGKNGFDDFIERWHV